MFEVRQNGSYKTYNGINKDEFSWKIYNKTLRLNDHDVIELVFDLSDVNLQGTENFVSQMMEVINRF